MTAARVSLRVPVTPMVRRIMWACAGLYAAAVTVFIAQGTDARLAGTVYLVPSEVLGSWRIWTLFTYGWFHELGARPVVSLLVCAFVGWLLVLWYRSPAAQANPAMFWIVAFMVSVLVSAMGFGAPLHLGGNVLGLYFFGHLFETRWGSGRFLLFWTLCVIGGGVATVAVWLAAPAFAGNAAVLGASAGVMGLICAFSIYFPEQTALYGMLLPLKGKHFILVVLGFDLINLVTGAHVAVFAHLGGVAVAALLCTGYWRPAKIIQRVTGKKPPKKKRPSHLRVVRDDDDDDEKPRRYLH